MAAPAPRRARVERRPTYQEPTRLQRSLVRERAKRRARIEHERERRRARRRFAVLILALLFFAAILSLTIWDEIETLFGL
jgi:ferric-dicitrate binding protein FerR (iron transport regulator)